VTTNQVLAGVGLILVLAVGSQVLASRLRIPALIVLLPVGFIAGAVTTDVNPQRLLGAAFQPLVSLSVAVILYDAGLSLNLRKLQGHTRRIVTRLIVMGVPITLGFAAVFAALLLGMSSRAAVMIGAIPERTRPLLIGGEAWVIDLACGLRSAGLDVLMWAGLEEERERIKRAGLELAPGELLAAATGRGAELEGINAVLLLTTEDDFNALASAMLAGSVEGAVYRLGPQLPSHGVVAPYTGGQVLFGAGLTRYDVGHRYVGGARITSRPADGELPVGTDLLFLVRADGKLMPVTTASTPALQSGDTMIVLESVLTSS
jgi:hypothetical protein